MKETLRVKRAIYKTACAVNDDGNDACLVPHANPPEIRDAFRGSSQLDRTSTPDTGREKGFDRPPQDPPFSTPGNSQS